MGNQEKTKGKQIVFTTVSLMLLFYIIIITYILFNIVHINKYENFICGLIFECIGYIILIGFVIQNIFRKNIKTGYFIPLVLSTVLYTILLDAVNIYGTGDMNNSSFFLVHMMLLFIFLLIALPMFIKGKQ